MKTLNLHLLRHGEIVEPKSLAGHTDFLLSQKGVKQMQKAIAELSFSHCITSSLSRCADVATDFCDALNVEVVKEDKIKEMNFGDWDGVAFEQLWQMPKPNIGDFWQSPYQVCPPNGESFQNFLDRVAQWWQTTLASAEQDTLVITHAGVIKVIIALVLSSSQDSSQIEKIVTSVSVGYGQLITLSVFKEESFPPFVQIKL